MDLMHCIFYFKKKMNNLADLNNECGDGGWDTYVAEHKSNRLLL